MYVYVHQAEDNIFVSLYDLYRFLASWKEGKENENSEMRTDADIELRNVIDCGVVPGSRRHWDKRVEEYVVRFHRKKSETEQRIRQLYNLYDF